jgi:hypothetical protein
MNADYKKTIYTYCDDVIRFARTLDYDMGIDMKKDMVISRLKSDNVYLYDYEIIIESMIEIYFEVSCSCTVI